MKLKVDHISRLTFMMAIGGGVWGVGLSIIWLLRGDALPFLFLLLLIHVVVVVVALWREIRPLWRATMWIGAGGLLCYCIYLSRFSIGTYLIPATGLILLAGVLALVRASPVAQDKPDRSSHPEPPQAETNEHQIDPRLRELTPRELEVLILIAEGKSNKEIARALVISPNTVRQHVHHLLHKLNCSSRSEAAVIAKAVGLRSPNRTSEGRSFRSMD